MSIFLAMIAASSSPTNVIDKSFTCKVATGWHFSDNSDGEELEETTTFTTDQISSFSFVISFFERNGKMMAEIESDKYYDSFKLNGIHLSRINHPGNFSIDHYSKDYLTFSTEFSRFSFSYISNEYAKKSYDGYLPKPFENFTSLYATCEPKT